MTYDRSISPLHTVTHTILTHHIITLETIIFNITYIGISPLHTHSHSKGLQTQIHSLRSYLKGVVEFDDPLVIRLSQNVPLSLDVRHLVPLEHIGLPQGLHGIQAVSVNLQDQRHLPKRAHTCE